MTLNPFHGIDLLQCPLKTSSTLWFFTEKYQRHERAKDIFNKYVKVLIFMFVAQQRMPSYSRSALVLSMHPRGIKFQCFLI